jgi:hypothetical protein
MIALNVGSTPQMEFLIVCLSKGALTKDMSQVTIDSALAQDSPTHFSDELLIT